MKKKLKKQYEKVGIMKKTGHKFIKKDDCWIVECLETGGRFSTKLWTDNKVQQNVCPCCERYIVRRRR